MSRHGRTNKGVKKHRTTSGSRIKAISHKSAKKTCALCENALHGVPHGKRVAKVRKLSKSEKRPSVPFGGILCGPCRKQVIEEAAKVVSGTKEEFEIEFRFRPFVEQAMIQIKK
ncbi:MAG: 50S ribosomal protein L34e [Candidatus Micrarchaeota archaeon]